MDINDAMIYRQPVEAEEFAQMIVDHFDTVYREGGENGRVMCIALHPYMMGAPHRLKHLDRALGYIRKHKDAWVCTAEEILVPVTPDLPAIREVRREFLGSEPPASTLVEISRLVRDDYLIEIEATAVIPERRSAWTAKPCDMPWR